MPARNASASLPRCLEAITSAQAAPEEVIVVDDASVDETARLASTLATKVVRLDGSVGASAARNAGARQARGDVLVFVDSDVLVPPDAFLRVRAHMEDPTITAVQGVYDARCPCGNVPSQYKNLYYHYAWTHRVKDRWLVSAASFFLAVRARSFWEVGGFDEGIKAPTVEDADLGHRLTRQGARILLDPRIQVTHLRRYGTLELLRYDFRLASAKTRLLLRTLARRDWTVLSPRRGAVSTARVGEMLPWLAGLGLVAAALGLLAFGRPWGGAVLGLVALAVQHQFLAFVGRVRGRGQALLTAAYMLLDMAAVDAGIAAGVVGFMVGKRY